MKTNNNIKKFRAEAKRLAVKGVGLKNAAKRTRDKTEKNELIAEANSYFAIREQLLLYIRTGKPAGYIYKAPDQQIKEKPTARINLKSEPEPLKNNHSNLNEAEHRKANNSLRGSFKKIIDKIILFIKNTWKQIKIYSRN